MESGLIRLSPFAPGESVPARGRARPHDPAALAAVRVLIETSGLSYRAIAARTGVPIATIARHVAAGGWLRPEGTRPAVPLTPALWRRRRRGAIAERLLRRIEWLVLRIEADPGASPKALARAVRLLQLAEDLERPGRPRKRRSCA